MSWQCVKCEARCSALLSACGNCGELRTRGTPWSLAQAGLSRPWNWREQLRQTLLLAPRRPRRLQFSTRTLLALMVLTALAASAPRAILAQLAVVLPLGAAAAIIGAVLTRIAIAGVFGASQLVTRYRSYNAQSSAAPPAGRGGGATPRLIELRVQEPASTST